VKIAVIGCGAIGSYYGAMLARSGEDVHFLLRSDYQAVAERGLNIRSKRGDFHLRPNIYSAPESIGPSDLVLIGLKTTANQAFPELLAPLVRPCTAVLTLQNGLGNEEALARLFSPEQVMGGLCFVCLNRLEPGLIHHIEHGLIKIGEFRGPASARARDIVARFKQAGVPCEVTDDLAKAHWEKLVWNVPFNGLGVASAAGYEAVISGDYDARTSLGPCLTTDELLADRRWARLLYELMLEVITSAQALGMDLSPAIADSQIERTRSMGAYRASTLIDFERGLPLELQSLFLEPLRQALSARTPVPRLQAMCRVLEALDARKKP
jgi:2-dehydropantoate 2-reductase